MDGPSAIAWPDLELVMTTEPLGSVVVFTTPTSICLEPQSAWPDAVRLDATGAATGLVALEAGETFAVSTRWSWHRPRGGAGGF